MDTKRTSGNGADGRLRRSIVYGVVAVVILLIASGGAIFWFHGAHRQENDAIAAIHARGWRALPTDFSQPDPIPDSENAAFFLNRAARSLKTSDAYERAIDQLHPDWLPLTDEESRIIAATVAANPSALANADRARSLSKAVWNVPVANIWNVNSTDPVYIQQRALAQFLGSVWHCWNTSTARTPRPSASCGMY